MFNVPAIFTFYLKAFVIVGIILFSSTVAMIVLHCNGLLGIILHPAAASGSLTLAHAVTVVELTMPSLALI